MPPFTVAVLLFADHLELAQRCLGSIAASDGAGHVADLRIGLNQASPRVRGFAQQWALETAAQWQCPVTLYDAPENRFKYPLMRRMIRDEPPARWWMWFDDDSYLDHTVPSWWDVVEAAAETRYPAMVGQVWRLKMQGKQWDFILQQPWFSPMAGRPPHEQFQFCQGAWWVIPSEILLRYNWPIPELRHCGGDSLLGELLRQNGIPLVRFDRGVRINADEQGRHSKAVRRGHTEKELGREPVSGDLSHHQFKLYRMRVTPQ